MVADPISIARSIKKRSKAISLIRASGAAASTHPLSPRKIALVGDACRRRGYIHCTATATELRRPCGKGSREEGTAAIPCAAHRSSGKKEAGITIRSRSPPHSMISARAGCPCSPGVVSSTSAITPVSRNIRVGVSRADACYGVGRNGRTSPRASTRAPILASSRNEPTSLRCRNMVSGGGDRRRPRRNARSNVRARTRAGRSEFGKSYGPTRRSGSHTRKMTSITACRRSAESSDDAYPILIASRATLSRSSAMTLRVMRA